ncbi:MAG: hypothetical protein HZY76_12090 [Anaerolineae bacterium]|nr:MAG: hypothetical protein HZY76_12090 [Anaerolineae bacterium]
MASDSPRAFALKGSDGPVVALTSSEDASWIAASFADTSVRIWPSSDFQSPPIFLNGHNGPVQAIAFSSDGRWLATGSMDKTIHLWNVANLDKPPLVLSGHEDSIASVVFSVDGRWLASRSSDNMLHLWDVADPSTAIIEQRNVEEDGLLAQMDIGFWLMLRRRLRGFGI